ncbi:MAG TPA: 3-methyl-2-oxobutanoate hydroxymethyltransferase [Fibrobacteraceae bacterium]|nr:3-methyl-2-oxobutanoate hydroxymethyltransferase [Fibrobacteraceae bacterium]
MLTPSEITKRKRQNPIAMITAYDACFARIAEAAGIDMILVGDSAANVMLGYSTTREIHMEDMLLLTAAVRRGAPNTHVVADMPWQSDCDVQTALQNARRFIEVGANSVKLEGSRLDVVRALRQESISVVGHLGLLPQTATNFKQRGQSTEEAEKIYDDALALEDAGIFALVLEHIPERLGALISQGLRGIPTIGIGAGQQVDGQVLVLHDALGMHPFPLPPFARKFADLYEQGVAGLRRYIEVTRNSAEKNSYSALARDTSN